MQSDTPSGMKHRYPEEMEIIVVDDEDALRDVVCEMLEALGYRTFQAKSAYDAMVYMEHRTPALVITDIMMPNADGFALIRRMRANDALAEVPIVVLSARATSESRDAATRIGADAFMPKPFTSLELERIVRSFLDDPS
jgi:two-component system alkaline phosphatase synthesis response regulator PhoP